MPLAPRLKNGFISKLFGFQKNSTSLTGILLAINIGVAGGKIWESSQETLGSIILLISDIFWSIVSLTWISVLRQSWRYSFDGEVRKPRPPPPPPRAGGGAVAGRYVGR